MSIGEGNYFATEPTSMLNCQVMDSLAQFIQAAAGAGFIAKMIVDGIRMAVDMPRWMPILLAFAFAQMGEFLLLLSQNATFTRVTVAQAVLIGIIAWSTAIGVTELQKRVAEKPKGSE
jgi:hypothetical protein